MKLSIKNLFAFLFPLLVCSLYLPPLFYSLFTACLVVLAIVALSNGYKFHYKQALPWLFIGFFLVHLFGFFLSNDHEELLKAVQNKLSFVLLPFVLMVFQPLLTQVFFKRLINAFFYSSVIISVVFIAISLNNLIDQYQNLPPGQSHEDVKWLHHFYSSILTHGYIHRSYFGLLLGAALFSSPFIIPDSKTHRAFFIMAIALLIVVLILLQSRMILVAFALSALLYVAIKIIKGRSAKWAIYLLAGVISLSVFSYYFKDSPYNRFNLIAWKDYSLSAESSEFTGTTIRLAIWENSIELIKQHPLLGVGYGELQEKRLKVYQENNFKIGEKKEFNSHNQLLETQLVAGIPGSFFLLAMFITILWIAIKRKDTHLFILTSFVFLSMLTEAMFERQLAISFFCTYILALALAKKISTKRKEPA